MKLKVADLALDEVVVIGYGTAKKGNVTGSIATLKGEKVADRQNENVLSSLQGQLAGVEITTNSGRRVANWKYISEALHLSMPAINRFM